MRPTKEMLDSKARRYMLICLAMLFSLIFGVACCSSSTTETNKESQTKITVSYGDMSDVPDDGKAHTIYTDSFGTKLKAKVIHIGNSYTSHVIWLETERGSIYESSVSTH